MFGTLLRSLRRPGTRRPGRAQAKRSSQLVVESLEDRALLSVDQSFDPVVQGTNSVSAGMSSSNTNQERAQTFNVGTSGILSRVDVYVRRFGGDTGDLVLEIRDTQANGRPTSGAGQELIHVAAPATSVPLLPQPASFFVFDLSSFNLAVTQGQQLAVTLHVGVAAGGNITYQWMGSTGNFYAAGGECERVIGNFEWNAIDTDIDLGFRTFVDAVAQQPPVVTLPGGSVSYAEGATPSILAPGATVTDPDSLNFDTGTLTASLTANGNVDDRLGIRNEGTTAGLIGVSGNTVTFGGTAIGTYSGGVGTTPLVLTLNAAATPTATQALIRNLTYHTVSDTPTTAARTVEIVLADGDGGTGDPDTTTVTVTATNDAPTVAINAGLTVLEGATGAIGPALLAATDPDNTDLTFTVTTTPAHGTLLRDGVAATTFAQADIDAGLISYQHDGSEMGTDGFTITVGDGSATTAPTNFNITVTPQNDPPVVATNIGLAVVRSLTVTINSTRLSVTDPDNGPAQLTYTVMTGPTHGTLRVSGNPVSTFTQADINAGLVSYQHDGNAAGDDSFTFVASDGSVSTIPTTVTIGVLTNVGSLMTVSGFNPTTGTVTFTGDAGGNLNDHLELFAVDVGAGQYALGHNLLDPGLESNTDLDPVTVGVQQLILGSGTAPLITVNLLAGDDSLGIDNTGGHFTTPVAFDGGADHDLLRLDGTLANNWSLTGVNLGAVTGTAVGFTGAEDLTGSDGDDTFVFGGGADIGRLDGRAGVNTIDYSSQATPVEVFLPAGSASHTTAISGIRIVVGGSAGDLLVGGAGGAVLTGGAGDDSIVGGAGNDVLTGGAGNDLLIGGGGFDQVVETMPTVATITLTNTSLSGGADTGVDLLAGIEGAQLTGGASNNIILAKAFTLGPVTLIGGAGNDKLYGGTQGDLLIGGDGKDNLIGGAGNDTLTGGLGNDILNGGAGDDLVRETDIAGGNVNLTSGRLKISDSALGSDTLISIGRAYLSLAASETVGRMMSATGFRTGPVTLVGGAGADTLIGTVRAGDLLVGGAGADTLNSGKGADTVDGGPDFDVHVTLNGAALDDIVIDVP